MRHTTHTFLITIVTFLFAIAACQDGNDFGEGYKTIPDPIPPKHQDTLKVSSTSHDFKPEGETWNLDVTSNVSWNISKQPQWITVDTDGYSGSKTVKLTATENNTGKVRKDTVSFTTANGSITRDVVCTQSPIVVPTKDTIYIEPITISEFIAAGETKKVKVTANNTWSISVEYQGGVSGWLKSPQFSVNYVKGVEIPINIEAEKNNSTDDRKATITFTCGTASAPLNIVQKGADKPYTIITPPEDFNECLTFEYSADPEGKVFDVKSNESWTVSINQEGNWCYTVPISESKNDGTVRVTVAENNDTTRREAELTITGKSSNTPYTCIIKQKGKPYTKVTSKTELEFGLASETKEINIESNEEWEADLTGDDTSWIESISSQNGSNSETVKVKAKANNTDTKHSATITIKGKTSGNTTPVTVKQEAITLSIKPTTSKTFEKNADSGTFTITCNTTWTATSSDDSWCTVNKKDDATLTVSVKENTATTERNATVTVQAGDVKRPIDIIQTGADTYIYIDGNKSLTVGKDGGEQTIKVITNDGPFKVISSNEDWCKGPKEEVSGNTFNLEVEANSTLSKRTATITVKSKNGKTDTLTVTQKAGNIGVEEYE